MRPRCRARRCRRHSAIRLRRHRWRAPYHRLFFCSRLPPLGVATRGVMSQLCYLSADFESCTGVFDSGSKARYVRYRYDLTQLGTLVDRHYYGDLSSSSGEVSAFETCCTPPHNGGVFGLRCHGREQVASRSSGEQEPWQSPTVILLIRSICRRLSKAKRLTSVAARMAATRPCSSSRVIRAARVFARPPRGRAGALVAPLRPVRASSPYTHPPSSHLF